MSEHPAARKMREWRARNTQAAERLVTMHSAQWDAA